MNEKKANNSTWTFTPELDLRRWELELMGPGCYPSSKGPGAFIAIFSLFDEEDFQK